MSFFNTLVESLKFAFGALIVNKLRTVLSLLGITIGIFAIILVYAAVDSLEYSIRSSVDSLGSDVIYVQKWPWGGGEDFPWWKYFQRPEPRYREAVELERRVTSADKIGYAFAISRTVQYKNSHAENTSIFCVTHTYSDLWELDFDKGRYFSTMESKSGRPVGIIGADLAEGLFGSEDPIGKEIRILGRKVSIIGVLKKEGSALIGQSHDELVLLPVEFAVMIVNENNIDGSMIMVKQKEGASVDQLKDELRVAMRAIRRLRPTSDDDFSLNQTSIMSAGLDAMFGIIGLAGTAIGGFSILVGGFGIANIMFVSVRERTGQVGIQKALGARNSFILAQFLFESVILSLIGGIIGLILVLMVTYAVTAILEFNIFLSFWNVFQGVSISVVIGLVAGFIPALQAARMDPVEAIRVNS